MKFKLSMCDIMKEYDMDPLIIVPKNGGLKDVVSRTLKEMGVDYLKSKKVDRDNYKSGGLTVSVYRAEDIPQVIEDLYFDKKIKALGFIGDDLFDEYKLRNSRTILQVFETVDWIDNKAKFMRPALCMMKRKGENLDGIVNVAVNEKYEQTSRKVLEEIGWIIGYAECRDGEKPEELRCLSNFKANVRVYKGNTELTVAQGLNDICIEIVYSGSSIKRNGLEIIGKPLRVSDFDIIGVNESNPYVFKREYQMIVDRIKNPKEGSFTSELASDPNKSVKKVGEELAEFNRALGRYETSVDKEKARKDVLIEVPDLVYTIFVNAARCGIDFKDITKKMYQRMKKD